MRRKELYDRSELWWNSIQPKYPYETEVKDVKVVVDVVTSPWEIDDVEEYARCLKDFCPSYSMDN